jgi:GT2 family glycosyltransferase
MTSVSVDTSGRTASTALPDVLVWSVLIVSYGDAPALRACLAAVEQQRSPGCEVIVVDNRGSAETAAAVASSPQARLLAPGRNLGYGAGNNVAAAAARGRYLLVLNPDVVLAPRFLQRMAEALAVAPALGLVTATLLLPDGRVNALGNVVAYSGITTCRALGDRLFPTGVYPVPAISGAAFAIRRSDFHALGGFDEHFFLYLEDTDLSLRARLQGGSCWCVGDAIARHDYHWRFSPAKQLELEHNRLQVLLKTFRLPTLLALAPGLLLVEAGTLAYATWRGPAYLGAKVRAYGRILQRYGSLRARREDVQARRVISDRLLLTSLTWRIPFRQPLGPRLGAALEWLLAPALYLPYAVAHGLAGRR